MYVYTGNGIFMTSNNVFLSALANIGEGLLIAEYQGSVNPAVFVNDTLLKMTGYTRDDLLGNDFSFMSFPQSEAETLEELELAQLSGKESCVRLRQNTKTGRLFWCELRVSYAYENGAISHVLMFFRDISQEEYLKSVLDKVNFLYREMSKRLEFTNETDMLTKLKNRGHLSTRGEFMLGAAKREGLRLHAVVIDIDNFKLINAAGGNGLGDECLVRTADIIKRYFCRATDIAIRMCEAEFVIICIEDDDGRIRERAEQLRKDVKALTIKDYATKNHNITVSIGIHSITPEKRTTLEEMIERAGRLIYQDTPKGYDSVFHDSANDSFYPFIKHV